MTRISQTRNRVQFLSIFAAAMLLTATSAVSVAAEQNNLGHSSMLMNYATDTYEEQSDFPDFGPEEELHELNDAWLGMPVYETQSNLVGFVTDALLGSNGEMELLVVQLASDGRLVEMPSLYAELSDIAVEVAMTEVQISALTDVSDEYEMASN